MSIVLSDLSFILPNGRVVLSGLNASFGPGRTGLIGVNGSGKSTLLRLIAGELDGLDVADEQPGHGVGAATVPGAVLLPGSAARGESRRTVPPLDRDNPLAAPVPGRPPDRHQPPVAPASCCYHVQLRIRFCLYITFGRFLVRFVLVLGTKSDVRWAVGRAREIKGHRTLLSYHVGEVLKPRGSTAHRAGLGGGKIRRPMGCGAV